MLVTYYKYDFGFLENNWEAIKTIWAELNKAASVLKIHTKEKVETLDISICMKIMIDNLIFWEIPWTIVLLIISEYGILMFAGMALLP